MVQRFSADVPFLPRIINEFRFPVQIRGRQKKTLEPGYDIVVLSYIGWLENEK